MSIHWIQTKLYIL